HPLCRAYARNVDACNANAVPPVLDNEWKETRDTDAAPMTWECFTGAFLNRFFPRELREAKAQECMNLRQVQCQSKSTG
ncbi:hypothetical protein MTR67_048470, partial [Solanum verrucosum]